MRPPWPENLWISSFTSAHSCSGWRLWTNQTNYQQHALGTRPMAKPLWDDSEGKCSIIYEQVISYQDYLEHPWIKIMGNWEDQWQRKRRQTQRRGWRSDPLELHLRPDAGGVKLDPVNWTGELQWWGHVEAMGTPMWTPMIWVIYVDNHYIIIDNIRYLDKTWQNMTKAYEFLVTYSHWAELILQSRTRTMLWPTSWRRQWRTVPWYRHMATVCDKLRSFEKRYLQRKMCFSSTFGLHFDDLWWSLIIGSTFSERSPGSPWTVLRRGICSLRRTSIADREGLEGYDNILFHIFHIIHMMFIDVLYINDSSWYDSICNQYVCGRFLNHVFVVPPSGICFLLGCVLLRFTLVKNLHCCKISFSPTPVLGNPI